MKFLLPSLPLILVVLGTFLGSTNGQIGNYVLTAYQSAMAMREIFEYNVENFREYLNSEAQDLGTYLNNRMIIALETPATTQQQGAALQSCARLAAAESRATINGFDSHLVELQDASMRLHLTVYEQLSETNLKAIDLDEFYALHSKRMDDHYDHLNAYHLERIYYQLVDLWLAYFVIASEMDDCIDAALLV